MKLTASILSLIGSQLFIYSFCIAQTNRIDSLKNILPGTSGVTMIECLDDLSYAYIQVMNKDSAEYCATTALKKAIEINYAHGIALSLSRRAEIAMRLEADFKEAEQLGKESLSWYKKNPDIKGLDNLYGIMWISSFAQSKYDDALRYAEEIYKLYKDLGDPANTWGALNMKSIVYKESGNYEKCFYYNRKAYEIAIDNKLPVVSESLFIFGELYLQIKDYAAALDHFRRGFSLMTQPVKEDLHSSGWEIWVKMEFAEIFSQLGQFDSAWHYYHQFKPTEKIFDRIYLVSTGECYYLQKKFKPALANFLSGLEFHRKFNDNNQVMRTLLDVAKTYVELGNDSAALRFAREGLAAALANKARQFTRDGYHIIYMIYDRSQKIDSANYYFLKLTQINDSVVNDQTKAKLAAYNYEEKIALVKKEKEIQQVKLEKETIMKRILLAGMVLLLLIGLISFRTIVLKRKIEKQRLEHELGVQKLESEKTRAEWERQASELEMQALRSQMNPHFIFNSLNSINMFILENNRLQASEYLSKFSKLVRLILQNSQETFIPLEKELEALQLYLELESLRFADKFEYKIAVEGNIDTTMLKVPPLIIQPYAENAIWHGLMQKKENGRLEIVIYLEEEILFYKITDDGIGRKKATELRSKSASMQKSMGMRITADRIVMLQLQRNKTSITITDLVLADGNPGGTEVLIKIPASYD